MFNNLYSNTYYIGLRNHPHLSWNNQGVPRPPSNLGLIQEQSFIGGYYAHEHDANVKATHVKDGAIQAID